MRARTTALAGIIESPIIYELHCSP
jgi:hypothetical protein